MNLHSLKWTKNIRHQENGLWAYNQFGVGTIFKLAWKKSEVNASKPQRKDLILLRQKGYVTHLVRVLDYKPEYETEQDEFDIYRLVEVLWVIDWNDTLVRADEVFGYSGVLKYQNGNVMELEKITSKHWESKGGFTAFQNHVHTSLNLK